MKYESHFEKGDFSGQLKQRREKDKILGYTSAGIHKDDLDMQMDGYSIKRVGSQGQNKTYVVALKFAQFDFLRQIGSTTPVLLLDDIFWKQSQKANDRKDMSGYVPGKPKLPGNIPVNVDAHVS